MIINCPCNEKKLFCWEDYTTLWSNRFITDRHPRPLTGVWKILPGTGHHFFHSQPSWPRVPFAVTVRRSPEALPHHHCPRPRAGWKGGPPYLEQKKGSPERGGSSCRPSASICPAIPPSREQAGLDVPSNLNQVKRDFQINPWSRKLDSVWVRLRRMPVCDATALKFSAEGEFFLNTILSQK